MKAGSMVHTIELARAQLDAATFARILASVPEATRELVSRPLLAIEWIAAETWLPFQRALLAIGFEGDERRYRKFAHTICEKDFNVFHRMVLKLASPLFVVERATGLFSTYSDTGKLIVGEVVRDGKAASIRVTLDDFETADGMMGVLIHAFIEKILMMTGAREVDVKRTRNDVTTGRLRTELDVRFTVR